MTSNFIPYNIMTSNFIPQQIHLAFAGLTTLAISWMTITNISNSIVKYGLEPNIYNYTGKGYSTSYYESFHHHVVLPDNLKPNKDYYYIVGNSLDSWSREFMFKAPDYNKVNPSFIIYGDLGSMNGNDTIDYLDSVKDSVDLFWHGGDISYADDAFLHKDCVFKFCYEEAWDRFMSYIEPFASYKPYMVVPGNHDIECHDPSCLFDSNRRNKLSNFSAYNSRFRMPSPESNGVLNMYYSWNYGPIHFISIDTETGFPGAEEEKRYVLPCGKFGNQLTWLENDLKQANKSRDIRPWVFVQGHHPMYQGDFVDIDFQNAMEELFNKYAVDIYFSGHIHSYERTWPVYKSQVEKTYDNPSGTTYIMVGNAGNDEMDDVIVSTSNNIVPNHKLNKESENPGPWTAITDKNQFGIGRVNIIDKSNLEFQYIRTKTGEIHDTIKLSRIH